MRVEKYNFESPRKCKECGCEDVSVVDSRIEFNGITRRRKLCNKCGCRYNTYEITEADLFELTNGYKGKEQRLNTLKLKQKVRELLIEIDKY